MKNEKLKLTFKIVGVTLLSLILIVCLILDVWFLYIKFHGEEKVVSTTYEVGLQETTSGDKKPFIEIEYFSNANKNGYECFGIKFNYLLDEKQDSFYSQGLQYVPILSNGKIGFGFSPKYLDKNSKTRIKGYPIGKSYRYNYFGRFVPFSTLVYNYSSADDYVTSYVSTNPIGNTTSFKIQLGGVDGSIYMMKFRSNENVVNDQTFYYASNKHSALHTKLFGTVYDFYYYYSYMDYNFFVKTLLKSVKSLPSGKSSYMVFEFGDYFDYYLYDKDKCQYSEKRVKDSTKLISEMKSYYVIKVNVSSDGLNSSSDSMFNMFKGSANYNVKTSNVADGYFYGRSVYKLNIDDFVFIDTDTLNVFELKLKDSVRDYYLPYSDKIEFDIDLSELDSSLTVVGFTDDCFKDFKVYRVVGLEVQNV